MLLLAAVRDAALAADPNPKPNPKPNPIPIPIPNPNPNQVRDAALAADPAAAAPLARLVSSVLLRPKTAPPSVAPSDGAALRYAYMRRVWLG